MRINLDLPEMSEDEAYNWIVSSIASEVGPIVDLSSIIKSYLDKHKLASTPDRPDVYQYEFDVKKNFEPFVSTVWRLCIRGVLAQLPPDTNGQDTRYTQAGNRFIVTEYGAEWLSNRPEYDCSPMEYGRFSQLLTRHEPRLGKGYHARSQKALHSYRAQNYLACCSMCGAAAESITLALAIAKKGDEKAALKMYGQSGGRGKIEGFLLAGQDGHIIRNLPCYTSLLNDWRDIAAHGAAPIVGEDEAFTALLLLLRYAKFADERWDDISKRASLT